MNSKILVVDDEEGIITLLKDYFEINDYEVYTAHNGKEALEKYLKIQTLFYLI